MSNERIKEAEDYLTIKRKIHPEDIKIAKTHLLMVAKEMSEEELTNVKIHYQGKLSISSSNGHYIAIMAILVSILASIISLFSSLDNLTKFFYLLPLCILIFFIVLIAKMNQLIKKASKLCEAYTIIINLIDEILKDSSTRN